MTERQIKIVTTIGKVCGLATTATSCLHFLPDKYTWVGPALILISSTCKDVLAFLNDLWDNTPKDKVAALILIPLLAFGCLTFTGCNATLEPGGDYSQAGQQPDMAFFVADSAFDTAYATLDGAFKFERENRAFLWKLSPAIKQTLDKIRPTAWEVVQRYSVARKVYMLNPVPANLTALQTELGNMQRLTATALAALPAPK